MKRTGEILLFNGALAPALNAFGQLAIPTGLAAGGSDALLLLGAQCEYSVAMDGASSRQAALTRASKAAMPAITDDDVMVKMVTRQIFVTSGGIGQDSAPAFVMPPQSIVVVESNIYFQFQTTSQTSVMSANVNAWFERVVLTEAEKSAILAQRLNNLLN